MRDHDCGATTAGPGSCPGPQSANFWLLVRERCLRGNHQWWLIPSGRPLVSLASSTPTAEITQRIMM
jgi:hypothetical protein